MPLRSTPPGLRGALAAALLSLGAVAACDSLNPFDTRRELPGGAAEKAALSIVCTASVASRTVSCDVPQVSDDGPRRTIVGGQGKYVRLTSSNVAITRVDAAQDTFAFDVTVQNLLNEAMGTADGVSADPNGVRVFFADGPTVTSGNGSISVANADGGGTFTGSNQLYFAYGAAETGGDGILSGVLGGNGTGETSAARRWKLQFDRTVNTFTFKLYVDAQVQPMIAVNELMANPSLVQDSLGEYIELKNRGTLAVDLNGWSVTDGSGSGVGATFGIGKSVVVPGGSTVLLGRSGDSKLNGGIEPDLVTGTSLSTLSLSNTADWVRVRTPGGVTMDSVGYATGATSAKAGYSRERIAFDAGSVSVDDSTKWVYAKTIYNGVDRGTPTPLSGVTPGANGGVSLSANAPLYAPVGYDKPVFATVYDSVGNTVTGPLTWESLNPAVATVDSMGYVTGVDTGSVTIRATAASGATGTITLGVVAATAPNTASYLNHVEFGTPTDATPGDENVIARPQYVLSYNAARRQPNWVSWDLNASQFEQGGTNNVPRCNCFTDDPAVPVADRAYDYDYRGSGYDRGHMVQSESRTNTFQENATTFYLGNIVPQAGANNQGPWGKLETYMNSLVQSGGKEVYVISGGEYSSTPFTLNNAGRVPIPDYTWKVALIVPAGQGLSYATSADSVQVIAVRMPNLTERHVTSSDPRFAGTPTASGSIMNDPWQKYITTVDNIEANTGYDLFAALNDAVEAQVEARSGNGAVAKASKLLITSQPSPAINDGDVLPQQPVLQVTDSAGFAYPGAGRTVTASLLGSGGTLTGTPTAVSDSTGKVAFTNLGISGSGTFQLVFTSTGLASATSQNITVTGAVDQAPSVSSSIPANNASNVGTSSAIVFKFSEPVNFTASSFTLSCGAPVAFTVAGNGTDSARVTPSAALPNSTSCTATALAAGITDVDANDPPDNMAADYTTTFTTAAPAPAGAVLRLSEINASMANNRDLVELYVVQGGSVAGMKLMQDSATTLLTLPGATVQTGDVIVVHLVATAASGDATTSETVSKTENTATTNYATAWDFVNTAAGANIGASKRTIRILSATGEMQDAVSAVVTTAGTPPGTWPRSLQQIQALGQWSPVDCGGAPCTSTSSPTAEAVSAIWSGMASTVTGNSFRRISSTDTNTLSDWGVGASSFGVANP